MIATQPYLWCCLAGALTIMGCSSTPLAPDWALEAQSASERAVKAYMRGDTRIEAVEWRKTLDAVSATGQPSAMAQMALLQCAAQAAALAFSDCPAYRTYTSAASPAQQAYARYLQGQHMASDITQLPPAQQQVARQLLQPCAHIAALPVAEPLSQLTAAGVALQASAIAPTAVDQAVEVAAQQGWRRAAIAWVLVAQRLAQAGGNNAKAEALGLRLLVLQGDGAMLEKSKK